jgi:hypothetical protein
MSPSYISYYAAARCKYNHVHCVFRFILLATQNGLLSIWGLICALTGSALCDKAGRRPLFLTAISGMLIFWTLQTVCFAVDSIYHDINAGYVVIAMICAFIMHPCLTR